MNICGHLGWNWTSCQHQKNFFDRYNKMFLKKHGLRKIRGDCLVYTLRGSIFGMCSNFRKRGKACCDTLRWKGRWKNSKLFYVCNFLDYDEKIPDIFAYENLSIFGIEYLLNRHLPSCGENFQFWTFKVLEIIVGVIKSHGTKVCGEHALQLQ